MRQAAGPGTAGPEPNASQASGTCSRLSDLNSEVIPAYYQNRLASVLFCLRDSDSRVALHKMLLAWVVLA